MEHYKRTSIVANRLKEWIIDTDRPKWSEFCRGITEEFGVRRKFLEKLLEENYTTVEIHKEQLRSKQDG